MQSKCTINHFDGLNANESLLCIPLSHVLNSGHTKALPAYAASTCNHKLYSKHISPISFKLSKAHAPVVPRLAQTYELNI